MHEMHVVLECLVELHLLKGGVKFLSKNSELIDFLSFT